MSEALDKIIRLKKRKFFLRAAGQGVKVVLPGMVVQAFQTDADVLRVGFTVTKKMGCAVARNRIRRRLREVVRLSDDATKLVGYDVVVIGRHAALERDFDRLKNDFHQAAVHILGRRALKQKELVDKESHFPLESADIKKSNIESSVTDVALSQSLEKSNTVGICSQKDSETSSTVLKQHQVEG